MALAAPGAARALDCELCGEVIRGEYVSYDAIGWNVCAGCAARPKCAACDLPRAGDNEGDDGWCQRCLDASPRCASCGLPVRETYWKVAGSEALYCSRCKDIANECSVCGAPDRSGRFRDGRFFCDGCHRARVDDSGAWQAVYGQIIERAGEVLGMRLEHAPVLVIDDASVLGQRRGEAGPTDGLCGLYVRDANGNASIHVISHLPAARGAAVLAHEFAHAWQAENCPDEQGTRLREGFAEWVAWRLMDGWEGGESERAVIEARTDEYGMGFRLFRGLEESRGAGHALWYAAAARTGA